MRSFFIILYLLGSSFISQAQQTLSNGHSHNDYKQDRPLRDAIKLGFMSVEVDIWTVDDEFLVSHTRAGLKRSPSLHELYLEPLCIRIDSMDGRVYDNQVDEFVVMLDLKGSWTVGDLHQLEAYMDDFLEDFSVFRDGNYEQRALRILLSGNSGKYHAAELEPRYFSIDGGFHDIEGDLDIGEVPRTSSRYGAHFKWKGRGQQPEQERLKMIELVRAAHADGRKIRFWAVPNRTTVWQALLDAGVDWINVDRLERFHSFSLGQ